MKLFHAPRSPFAFKTRIAAHELGLAARIEFVTVDPWNDESLRRFNPLCKVPVLVLEDGETAFYDSPLICEYLSDAAGGGLIPASPRRWEALRHQALADGLAEAVIRRFVELTEPVGERARCVAERQETAISAALDALEGIAHSPTREATIGQVATAAALTYLSFRSPEIEWRKGRSLLAAWFDAFARRPSVVGAAFLLPAAA
jgi:glutathione S-transferase